MESVENMKLGELLVSAGVLTQEKLDDALERQKNTDSKERLGEILVNHGFINEVHLVQALSKQLSIPWVSIAHIDINDEILDLVPQNVAEEFGIIPIYVRPTRGGRDALYVAVADPTDDTALRFVAASSGLNVKPMIAGPTDISKALRFFYYDEEEIETPSVRKRQISKPPVSKPPVSKPPASVPAEAPAKNSVQGQEEIIEEIDDSDLHVVQEESPAVNGVEVAEKSSGESAEEKPEKKGVAITFLNGMTINLGGSETGLRTEERHTNLVEMLRSAAKTGDRSSLPADNLMEIIAALMAVLTRKHFVEEEEILEEIKKSHT